MSAQIEFFTRKVRSTAIALAALPLIALTETKAETMAACQKLAAACQKEAGEHDVMGHQCRRKVDACMNRARCEEAFLSCMELVELEETTEDACRIQHARCRGEQAAR